MIWGNQIFIRTKTYALWISGSHAFIQLHIAFGCVVIFQKRISTVCFYPAPVK